MRLRWFRLSLRGSYGALLSALQSSPYSRSLGHGFQAVESTTENQFDFLWTTLIPITSVSAGGIAEVTEIASLASQRFSISAQRRFVLLRVESSVRSTSRLMNALEHLAGAGFSVRPVELDEGSIQGALESFEYFEIVGIKISDVVVQPGVVARMEFASRTGMKLSSLKKLTGMKYRVEAASYAVLHRGLKGQVGFGPQGAVNFAGSLSSLLLSRIEKAVLKACSDR